MKIPFFIFLALFVLAGCDDSKKNDAVSAKSQEPVYEEAEFNCKSGDVSTECFITGGDQLGSGKWRHAKIDISGSDVSLNIDGESFAKQDVTSKFIDGKRLTYFELISAKGSRAVISVQRSNSGTKMRLEAWNSEGKLMLTSSR